MSGPIDMSENAKAEYDVETKSKPAGGSGSGKKPKLPIALFQQRPLPPTVSALGKNKLSQDISSDDGLSDTCLK